MDDRAPLGQVFTPPLLAQLTTQLVMTRYQGESVLDPACGDGRFLMAAQEFGVDTTMLKGIELDPKAAHHARQHLPESTIRISDFFAEPVSGYGYVLGNPPYLRAEKIPSQTRQRLRARLEECAPHLSDKERSHLASKADLALAFLVVAFAGLNEGGGLGFVLSLALFDSDYGRDLNRLLGKKAHIQLLLTSGEEKWFDDAQIHAAILIVRKMKEGEIAAKTKVGRLQMPLKQAARDIKTMEDLSARCAIEEFDWSRAVSPKELASRVRGASEWLDFVDEMGQLLRPLGAMAELHRGITSGDNAFFYVGKDCAFETETLVPILRSPRNHHELVVKSQTVDDFLFMPPGPDLSHWPHAQQYVRDHEKLGLRPTLRARTPWWLVRPRKAQVFLSKAYDQRFLQHWSSHPIVCDQRYYAVTERARLGQPFDAFSFAALLNSLPTLLAIESTGRASMGQGALELSVNDAKALPLLPLALSAQEAKEWHRLFLELGSCRQGSVFDEAKRPERRAFDVWFLGRFAKEPEKVRDRLMGGLLRLVAARKNRSR